MRTISTQVPTDPMGYVSFASRILISLAEGLCVQQHHITSGVGITIRQRLINFVRMPRQHKLTLLYSLFVIVDRMSNTEAFNLCEVYSNPMSSLRKYWCPSNKLLERHKSNIVEIIEPFWSWQHQRTDTMLSGWRCAMIISKFTPLESTY